MKNLPDDWTTFYKTCRKCGHKFHASAGACSKCLKDFEDKHLKDILNDIFNPKRND